MKRSCRSFGKLAVAGLLCAQMTVATIRAEAPTFEARYEDARKLAHDSETRSEGVAALRELIREQPDAAGPRYELARVLTWSRTGRAEGVALLSELVLEQPEQPEFQETLSEVLSWKRETRDDSIRSFRDLAGRYPERKSVRLKLAEVLSWDTATREESEAIYRELLDEDSESSGARVGLARLLSWRGEYSAARSLYGDVLDRDPSAADARLGLAQIEGWTGRARASMRSLDQIPESELDSRDVIKARGEAFEGLRMPSQALVEYERLLLEDPNDLWTRRRVNAIRDRLRPRLKLGLAGSTESGDPSTSKVKWLLIPVEYSWYPAGDIKLAVRADSGTYRNERGSTRRLSAGAGARAPVGRHVELSGELMLHDFDEAGGELTGSLDASVFPVDRLELTGGIERRLLTSSRLAAVGERIDGIIYGPAILEQAHAGVSARLGRYWDASLSVSAGSVEGSNLSDNDRTTLYGSFGRRFRIRSADLRAGFLWYELEYDKDLGGFPPLDLAGDGMTSRGVGGYFSPQRFRNRMVKLDASWSHGDRLDFFASGAVGRQQVEDIIGAKFSDKQTSSHALFVISWRASERLIVRGRLERQDVADAFDQSLAGVDLVVLF